jgi:nucleoside-diphosphate-sugar epimerase
MKTYLVTGGSGFIGSNICKLLLKKGYFVISFDNNSRKKINNQKITHKNIKYIEGNILDIRSLNKINKKIHGIFHLAFINGTKFFYEYPEKVLNVGVLGIINIINFAKEKKIKEFYLASSSEVYQTPNKIPTDENEIMKVPDAYNPRYSYGGAKIISELIAINYGKSFLKKLIIFRPHNVYGPNMGNEHAIPEIIKKIVDATKNKKRFIKIQGSGNETRTFNYIDDFIEGINILIEKSKGFNTYNIGSKQEISIKQLIKKMFKVMNLKMEIKLGKLTKGSTARRKPNISKITKIGYKPKITIENGVKRTIDWYLNN